MKTSIHPAGHWHHEFGLPTSSSIDIVCLFPPLSLVSSHHCLSSSLYTEQSLGLLRGESVGVPPGLSNFIPVRSCSPHRHLYSTHIKMKQFLRVSVLLLSAPGILGVTALFPLAFRPMAPMVRAPPEDVEDTEDTGNTTFQQLIDHKNPSLGTFAQRVWWNATYWGGPGNPVFDLPNLKLKSIFNLGASG